MKSQTSSAFNGRLLALAGLLIPFTLATAQDQCAAPGPSYSCVPPAPQNFGCAPQACDCHPQVSRAPARAPQQAPAAPAYMAVQRTVLQPETVMVPMTVMVQHTVFRPRTILENVPVAPAPAASPVAAIPQAPAADVAQAPVALQAPATPDCAGSSNTQMALMALMLANRNQTAAAPSRAPAANSVEIRDRISRLESKLDRLIEAVNKSK
jgi:hypothetical protein